MRFDEYFWDFDGTLFDTYPHITEAIRQGTSDLGIDISPERIMRLVKVSIPYMMEIVSQENGVEPGQLLDRYAAHKEAGGYADASPYAGTVALVRAIAERGGRNYLYTHSGNHTIGALERHGMGDCFVDFVTAEDRFPAKPAPNALLHLVKKHGLDPARCVMLGDRDIDVFAGINASMAGALFDPDGFFDDLSVAYRFRTMQEIGDAFVSYGGA